MGSSVQSTTVYDAYSHNDSCFSHVGFLSMNAIVVRVVNVEMVDNWLVIVVVTWPINSAT